VTPHAPLATRPDRSETADYYFTYIDQVGAGDICDILDAQAPETLALLRKIDEQGSTYRYAPDKWSIRDVIGHVNDAERLFVFRAFWFARGFDHPLPSFDQDVAVTFAGANDRSWDSHIDEFAAIRAASAAFFRSLPADAWTRRGIASDKPFTVRALAYITAGHVAHHVRILNERYLPNVS
jgi:DinB superfamily